MLYPVGKRTGDPSCRSELVTCWAVDAAAVTSVVPRGNVSNHIVSRPLPGLSHSVTPARRAVVAPSAMKYTTPLGPGQSGWHACQFRDGMATQPPGTRVKVYAYRLRGSPAIVWLT